MSAKRITGRKPKRSKAGTSRALHPAAGTDWSRVRAMRAGDVLSSIGGDPDAQKLPDAALRAFKPVGTPVVRAIRDRLGLSQQAFAERFGFNLRTVQDWEQGRRQPDGPARTLLALIDRYPDTIQTMIDRAAD